MPSIDILLPLLFLMYFIVHRFTKMSRKYNYLSLMILSLILLVHLILRSWVWMIYPLYIVLALIAYFSFPILKIKKENLSLSASKVGWNAAITISILSFILVALFPIRSIPKPTGNLIVGTTSWDIYTQRLEIYSNEPATTRSFRAQAWYPASMKTNKVSWLGDGPFTSQGLAIDFGFPGFIFNHLQYIDSNSYLNAPILEGKYPLVVISHGWSGFRQLHTDLAEELASNGYIVIGIEHTYGSVGTVFDDGRKISVNSEALPPRATTPNFLDYANALVNTYAGDIISLLDQIESYQSNDFKSEVFNNIDLSSVTLIGHSTGGGAAVKVGLTDNRIDNIIGLDAWVEPLKDYELEQGLKIPSMLIRSQAWYISYNNSYLKKLIDSSATKPTAFQMNGTTHYDFGMVYMFTTLAPFIGLQGKRGLQMPIDQNNLILEYLNAHSRESASIFDWQSIPDVEALFFP